MAQSEQQRQRKLAKKQSKSRAKHQQLARKQQELASMAGKMQASSKGEIVYCGICGTIADLSMGPVLIARQGPNRQVAIALFLLDLGCLGVKDIIATLRVPGEAKEIIEKMAREHSLQPAAPELARGLVEAAVAYARSLGFEPHAEYRKASPIWGDIDAESIEGRYEFGRDGMPYYCSGPFEDAARKELVIRTLERAVGEGNFLYTVGMDPSDMSSFERIHFEHFESDEDDDEDETDFSGSLGKILNAEGVRRIDESHP